MANVVYSEEWEGWVEGDARCQRIEETHTDTSGILLIGVALALLQLADGILTSIGVSRFGVGIEGNPLLRAMMREFGHIPTLTILKFIAVMIVIGLTLLAHRLPWVKNAMGALTCLYLVAAIIPWTYLLFIKPYI